MEDRLQSGTLALARPVDTVEPTATSDLTWHGDRRQAQRRWMLAPSQQAFWSTEGFFMVRRHPDAPPS